MAAPDITPVVVFIYGLIDPRNGHLRYVGRTKQTLARRRSAHIQNANKGAELHSQCWIRGVLMDGLKPEIVLIERSDEVSWVEAEQFWIEYWRALGADLTNRAIGGLGCLGFHHSLEQREKWSRERCGENHPLYGVKRPPEIHEALRQGREKWQNTVVHPMLGKKHSPETIAKIKARRAASQRTLTEAGRDGLRTAMAERWEDPEWREKWTETMSGENNPFYGKKWTPEMRAKLIKYGPDNFHFGRKRSEETKAKLREAALKREAAKRLKRT